VDEVAVPTRFRLAIGVVAAVAAAGTVVTVLESGDDAPLARGVVVAPNLSAARGATVTGATPRERHAARAALALIGGEARSMRLRFNDCRPSVLRCRTSHSTRTLYVYTRAASGAPRLTSGFLGALVARDAAGRLWERGEHVAWHVGPYGAEGVGRARASVPLARLRSAAHTLATRARRAAWGLSLRLYTTAGGALVVTVELDDRTLLASRNSAFISTLYGPTFHPPVWLTLLLIEGPGGVFEGGGGTSVGASYGGSLEPGQAPPAAPLPGWLKRSETRLEVTIRQMRRARTRSRTFTLRCGPDGRATAGATCSRLLRERAILFSPVQSDNVCLGFGGDEATVRGSVGGIELERSFSNCYGGVTQAWEDLLGVPRRRG
jgi:hypothetical protein